MCLIDVRSGYLYNAYVYCGKGSDGFSLLAEKRKMSNPSQAVLRLVKSRKAHIEFN